VEGGEVVGSVQKINGEASWKPFAPTQGTIRIDIPHI
jgi:hypothetical protein